MGRSRRHNYTNPLLISGSVGKLTRNDARDVASPGIPNKKTLERARLPERDERNRWRAGDSHGSPLSCPRVALAERLALWTVAGAAGPWLVPASVIKFSLLTPPGNIKWHLTRRVMNCARQEAGGMTAKEASLAAANLGIHQFIIPPRTNPPTPRCHLSLIMLIRTPLLSWRNGRLILTWWSQCFAHMRPLTGFNCSRIFLFFFYKKRICLNWNSFWKKKKEPWTFPNALMTKPRFHEKKNRRKKKRAPWMKWPRRDWTFSHQTLRLSGKPELLNVASGSPRCPFPKRLHSQNLIVLSKSHHQYVLEGH